MGKASHYLLYIFIICIILNDRLYANSCVESIQVPMPNACSRIISLNELMTGSIPVGAFISINDNNPSNGAIVDGISPVSGWKYGVFSSTGILICSGTLITKDYTPPNWSATDSLTWLNFDTLVLWRHDMSKIENVASTWTDIYEFYYTGKPIMAPDSCGGLQRISVTDRLDFTPCGEFENTLFRTFF